MRLFLLLDDEVLEQLLHLADLGRDYGAVGIRAAPHVEVVVMVVLRLVELAPSTNNSVDFLALFLGFNLLLAHYFLRYFPLVLRGAKDGRDVLRPDILTLPVGLGGVVDVHEHFKQGLVRNDLRVECDFDHFHVASGASFDLFIAGMLFLASAVAGHYFGDSGQLL